MSSGYSDKVYESVEKSMHGGAKGNRSGSTSKVLKMVLDGTVQEMLVRIGYDSRHTYVTPAVGADIGGAMDLVRAGYAVARSKWREGHSVMLVQGILILRVVTGHACLPALVQEWSPGTEDLLARD